MKNNYHAGMESAKQRVRNTETPAQKQYHAIKQDHKDALVLFRMGDFYELFYEDARIAHNVLWIALTARDKDSSNPIPMAWIPYHALEKYLPRLIDAGYKVARVEQLWTPVPGKVVQREVREVYTPATFIEGEMSWESMVCAIAPWDDNVWRHCIRGTFIDGHYTITTYASRESLINTIERIWPREIVVSEKISVNPDNINTIKKIPWSSITIHNEIDNPEDALLHILWLRSLQSMHRALWEWRIVCAALLFVYLYTAKKQSISITTIQHDQKSNTVHVDSITQKNLEIFASSYQGEKKYSLYNVLQCTQTGMGARILRQRLLYPSRNKEELEEQLQQIQDFYENTDRQAYIRSTLTTIGDIQKKYTTLVYAQQPTAWQVFALRSGIKTIQEDTVRQECIQRYWWKIDDRALLHTLYHEIVSVLNDKEPTEHWSLFVYGLDQEFDKIRRILFNADQEILDYQKYLVHNTWVQNIKIKYTTHWWYAIEITPKDIEKFLLSNDDTNTKLSFSRVQSRKLWERYSTQYLEDLQETLLTAQDTIMRIEQEKIRKIQESMKQGFSVWNKRFERVWSIDLAVNMAKISKEKRWIRPTLIDTQTTSNTSTHASTQALQCVWLRHPTIEHFLPPNEQFIPNDITIHQWWLHILTWPNMWWKSTYLRKVALAVLMAHAWLWVAADSAQIPLVDWIYARIGSWDNLAKQQSTFMTEMVEMANIIHNATEKSLVIIDELWRWTSTYDWLALTQAICVYMCQNVRAMTLFATHYYELVELCNQYPAIKAYRVTVKETQSWIVFLKKVEQWAVSKSYGLDVAKLAWIPYRILKDAQWILKEIWQRHDVPTQQWLFDEMGGSWKWNAANSEPPKEWGINVDNLSNYKNILAIIQEKDINELSPIDALLFLQKIKQLISEL
jgi:DNA mismatch repair protein MutS